MHVARVIFDLDQTLVHSSAVLPAFIDVCRHHGVSAERSIATFYRHTGRPLRDLLTLAGVETLAVEGAARAFWSQMRDDEPEPVDGADDLLRDLHSRGVTLYLSTGSRPQTAQTVLDATGWAPLFSLALGSDDVHPKGPEHYRRIIASSGLDAQSFAAGCASVGDGLFDMTNAVDHGVRHRVGVLYDRDRPGETALRTAGATSVIDRLEQLHAVLAEPAIS